jgi:general stress protein 26
VGADFPDAPDPADRSSVPDQPDLDAFARRMGTDTLGDERDDQRDDQPTDNETGRQPIPERLKNWREPVSSAATGLARGARVAATRLGSLSDRLVGGHDERLDLDALRRRIGGVRTAMVTTIDERGTLSSRPVAVQRVEESGDVWFVVDRDADWVVEGIDAVNVAIVDEGSTWVSVAGRATLDDDLDRLRQLWDPALDAWFPAGPSSAGPVALHVQADRWEYWTAPNAAARLIAETQARLSDTEPDLGQSGTVET